MASLSKWQIVRVSRFCEKYESMREMILQTIIIKVESVAVADEERFIERSLPAVCMRDAWLR